MQIGVFTRPRMIERQSANQQLLTQETVVLLVSFLVGKNNATSWGIRTSVCHIISSFIPTIMYVHFIIVGTLAKIIIINNSRTEKEEEKSG
jgi:hypothetical protein